MERSRPDIQAATEGGMGWLIWKTQAYNKLVVQ